MPEVKQPEMRAGSTRFSTADRDRQRFRRPPADSVYLWVVITVPSRSRSAPTSRLGRRLRDCAAAIDAELRTVR